MSASTNLPASPGAPRAFHVMAKPTGRDLQPRLQVLLLPVEGDALPGQPLPDGRRACSSTYIRQLLEAHSAAPRGHDRLAGRRADADGARLLPARRRARRAASARPGQRVATHDPDQRHAARRRVVRRSSASNGFLVGLSIDGPRELHDAYRVDKGGKPTFDQVMRGLGHLLRRTAWTLTCSPPCTRPTSDHGRGGLPLPARRARRALIQFIPIVERDTEQPAAQPTRSGPVHQARPRPLGDRRAVRAGS